MDELHRYMAEDMQHQLMRCLNLLEKDKDMAKTLGRQLRKVIDDMERDANLEQKGSREETWKPGPVRGFPEAGRRAGWAKACVNSLSKASPKPPLEPLSGVGKVETVEYIDPITNRKVIVPRTPSAQAPQKKEQEEFGMKEPDEGPDAASMDESFPPLEPALDRPDKAKSPEVAEVETAVTKSKEEPRKIQAQNPETETEADKLLREKDLERELKAIYEETYGKIESEPILSSYPKLTPGTNSASPAEDIAPSTEPSLYKILAIDPSTQQIQTADATSIAEDTHTPLTVVDVMQRLSNPSKFFPQFAPLQAQGYEIVSGSGDVLIFRKVRAASEPGTVFLRGATRPRRADAATNPVNPIDMMGSVPIIPNVGNFASPTGYVNYDPYEPSENETKTPKPKPPPPFRSTIDVRRGNEVFGGWNDVRPKEKWWRRGWKGVPMLVIFGLGFCTGGLSLTLWLKSMIGRERRRRRQEESGEGERRMLDVAAPAKESGAYERGGLVRYSYPPPAEERKTRWW